MKAGNIILLTRRKGKWYNPRVILSYLIALASTKDRNKIDTIATHSAIIYSDNNKLYVREMENKGSVSIELERYLKENKGRIKIKGHESIFATPEFNKKCKYEKVEYDFISLFFFQLIKVIINKSIGKETLYKRKCSEDTSRMFNILFNIFENVEHITPSNIDDLTKNWKIVWIG